MSGPRRARVDGRALRSVDSLGPGGDDEHARRARSSRCCSAAASAANERRRREGPSCGPPRRIGSCAARRAPRPRACAHGRSSWPCSRRARAAASGTRSRPRTRRRCSTACSRPITTRRSAISSAGRCSGGALALLLRPAMVTSMMGIKASTDLITKMLAVNNLVMGGRCVGGNDGDAASNGVLFFGGWTVLLTLVAGGRRLGPVRSAAADLEPRVGRVLRQPALDSSANRRDERRPGARVQRNDKERAGSGRVAAPGSRCARGRVARNRAHVPRRARRVLQCRPRPARMARHRAHPRPAGGRTEISMPLPRAGGPYPGLSPRARPAARAGAHFPFPRRRDRRSARVDDARAPLAAARASPGPKSSGRRFGASLPVSFMLS